MDEATIYIEASRRKKIVETLNHALPGMLLFFDGIESFTSGEPSDHIIGAWLGILAGTIFLSAVIHEMRFHRTGSHAAVAWIEVAAGIILIVEGINHYHAGKGFQPAHLYVLIGCLTTARGIFHTRIPRLRRIVFSREGILARTSPFRKVFVDWKQIASCMIQGTTIHIETDDHKNHSIRLGSAPNGEDILRHFALHAGAHGFSLRTPDKTSHKPTKELAHD